MTALSVAPITNTSTDLWGYTCDDLQSDIEVGDSAITGTLNFIADYSSAFGPGLDSGNYIALHCEVPDVEGVTITAGCDSPSTLDADGDVVTRIADKDTQTYTVTASKEGYETVTKTFSLTGLTCNDSVG